MSIKKIRMRPEGGDDYQTVLYPETSADQVKIGNTDIGFKIHSVETDLGTHLAEKASTTELGHVMVGANLTIDVDGKLNAKGGSVSSVNGKTGAVKIDTVDLRSLNTISLNLGMNASAGYESTALGREANASGSRSVTLGVKAKAKGEASSALGNNSKSVGIYSTSVGANSYSVGEYSASIGSGSRSLNDNEGSIGTEDTRYTTKWTVPGSFTVNGTKNFEMPHPKPSKKSTHRIRHSAVETPSAGDNIYRYQVTSIKMGDVQFLMLPDYFVHLNKNVQVFITPQGHFGNAYGKLNRETEQLEIHCQSEGEYNVLVIGTRNDNHQSVQDWDIKGVEREIGESWTGETYSFEVVEIIEVEEIKEVM